MRRNLTRSLVGGIIPAFVGITGTLIAVNYGDSIGKLSLLLAWTVLGYLALTDFGLTRSASKIASSRDASATELVAVLWRVSIPLGLLVTLVLFIAILASQGDAGLYFLLPVPLISALQFPLMGILEARGSFGYLAGQRSANSVASYLAPAILVAIAPSSLPFALALISVARLGMLLALVARVRISALAAARATFGRKKYSAVESKSIVPWLALSSLVGPILLYADRFVLATGFIEHDVWVYYAATSEILLKSYIIPTAFVAVWFPWLAANARHQLDKVRTRFLIWLPAITVIAALAGGIAAYFIVPDAVFHLLGAKPEWLRTARLVLSITFAATIMNWSSQLYIALLQALNAQKFVGLMQLAIVLPFIVALVASASAGGAVLVAVIYLLRIVIVWVGLLGRSMVSLRQSAHA
jgi:hypothetical protein